MDPNTMKLFDDPETKTVHLVDEDERKESVCGIKIHHKHTTWPASDISEINKMVGGKFDYSLCNNCQCMKITKY